MTPHQAGGLRISKQPFIGFTYSPIPTWLNITHTDGRDKVPVTVRITTAAATTSACRARRPHPKKSPLC